MRNIKFSQIRNTVYGIPRFTLMCFDLISFEEKKISDICPLVSELLPLAHAKGKLIGAKVWRGDKNKARLVIEAPSGLDGWLADQEKFPRYHDALLWGMGLDASLGWRKDSLEMLTEFASLPYTTPLDVVEKARKMAGEYVTGSYAKRRAYLIELAGAIVAARILRSKKMLPQKQKKKA